MEKEQRWNELKKKRMEQPCKRCGKERVDVTQLKVRKIYPYGKKSKPVQIIKKMTTICSKCGDMRVYKDILTGIIR